MGITGFVPIDLKCHLPMVFTYFALLAQIMASAYYGMSSNDLVEISASFMITITHVNTIYKVTSVLLRPLSTLDRIIDKPIFTLIDDHEMTILTKTLASCQKILTTYLVTIIGSVFFYGVTPLVANLQTHEKNYPTLAKFPFNPDDYYWAIFFGEYFATGLSALCNGCTFYTGFKMINNMVHTVQG